MPESYGTGRLWLTARDPHWVYATWDLPLEQQQRFNALSADGHLIVRTFKDAVGGEIVSEAHVHPESRHWFIHVGRGGTRYAAELGYRDRKGAWHSVATSLATLTPPDTEAEDTTVQFATLPPQVSFEQILEVVASVADEHVPWVEAVQQLRSQGHKELPAPLAAAPPAREDQPPPRPWTPEKARALAEMVSIDDVRRVWVGSLEITELVRRHLQQPASSPPGAQPPPAGQAQFAPGVSAISSPLGAAMPRPGAKGFWFSVNAEIVLYGATQPGATVTVGGRKIRLRPDGTFSYRFALPDGEYHLPITAASADGDNRRSAELRFGRSTIFRGDVGAHPQDPALKPPSINGE